MFYERIWLDSPTEDEYEQPPGTFGTRSNGTRVSAATLLERANDRIIRNRFIWVRALSSCQRFEYGVGTESWNGLNVTHVLTGRVSSPARLTHLLEGDGLEVVTKELQTYFHDIQNVVFRPKTRHYYHWLDQDVLTGERRHRAVFFIGEEFQQAMTRLETACAKELFDRRRKTEEWNKGRPARVEAARLEEERLAAEAEAEFDKGHEEITPEGLFMRKFRYPVFRSPSDLESVQWTVWQWPLVVESGDKE